jgi:DNA-binding PadR family transcriptional regulator
MNLSRLVVLGLLAEHGARHGHQLRRDAEMTRVDVWGGISVGSLNRELRGLETEGLVEAVRTEQVGRRPQRTIYQITDEGRRELSILREQAVGRLHLNADPVCIALIFAGTDDPAELAALLTRRKQQIRAELERIAVGREQGEAKGYLRPEISPLQAASFRRGELQLGAELTWHEEYDALLTGSAARPDLTSDQIDARQTP